MVMEARGIALSVPVYLVCAIGTTPAAGAV